MWSFFLFTVSFVALFLTIHQLSFAYQTPNDRRRSDSSPKDDDGKDMTMYVCPSLLFNVLASPSSIQENARNTSYFNEGVSPNLKCLLPSRSSLVIPLMSLSGSSFFSNYYYVIEFILSLITVKSPPSVMGNVTRSQVSPLRSLENYGITFSSQEIQHTPVNNKMTAHTMSGDGQLAASEAKRWIKEYESGLVDRRMTDIDEEIISYLRATKKSQGIGRWNNNGEEEEEDIEMMVQKGSATSDAGGVFSLLFGMTQQYATAIIQTFSSFSLLLSPAFSLWEHINNILIYVMNRLPTTTTEFCNLITEIFSTGFHYLQSPLYFLRVFNVMIRDPTALVTKVVTRIEYQIGETTASFTDTAAMTAAARLRSVRVFLVNPRKYIPYRRMGDVNGFKNNIVSNINEDYNVMGEEKENQNGESSLDERYVRRRNLNNNEENIEGESLINAITASKGENGPISCEAWETDHNDKNRDDDEIFLSDTRGPRRQQYRRRTTAGTHQHTDDLLVGKEYPSEEAIYNFAKRKKLKRVQQFLRHKIEGSVEEVCLTHVTSWIPPWLQALLNPTGIESRVRFRKPVLPISPYFPPSEISSSPDGKGNIQEGITIDNNRHQHEIDTGSATYDNNIKTPTYYTCDLAVPKVALGCLRIEAFYDNKDVEVSIFQVHAWDIKWAYLVLALIIISITKPSLVSNRLLQLISAAALGLLFIVILLIYFAFNELKKTNFGKVGIVVLFSSGGLLALSETVTNIVWFYLTKEIWVNPMVQVAVGGSAIVSALLSNFVFYAKVPMMTNVVLTVMQVGIVIVAVAHNREASAAVFIMYILLIISRERGRRISTDGVSIRPSNLIMTTVLFGPISLVLLPVRLLRWIIFIPLGVIGIINNKMGRGIYENDNGYPRDYYNHDDVTPQAYCLPIVSNTSIIRGATRQEKFDYYDREGSEHTRRALRDLVEHVQQHPSKYIGRVQDPGGLARFANLNDM